MLFSSPHLGQVQVFAFGVSGMVLGFCAKQFTQFSALPLLVSPHLGQTQGFAFFGSCIGFDFCVCVGAEFDFCVEEEYLSLPQAEHFFPLPN